MSEQKTFWQRLRNFTIWVCGIYACLIIFDFVYIHVTGQTPQQTLQLVTYSNIASTTRLDGCDPLNPCIDNRSQFLKQSSQVSYRAVGTGTWSVDMQFADGTPTSWTSFGSTAQVSNITPPSGIGYGIGPGSIQKPYHDYIRFVMAGNVTILNYSGSRQFWWLPSVAAIAFPITPSQGGSPLIDIAGYPYGAIANGTGSGGTSQTTTFQTAMTDLHTAGGGTLFVPDATLAYSIGYPGIQIPSDVTIWCESPKAVLQVTPAAFSSWPGGWSLIGNSLSANTTGLQNVHVKNCTLDGNRDNITGMTGADLTAFGVTLFGCSNCSVQGGTVKNAGDGVYVDCSGSARTTHGIGFTISNILITNSQRNNISYICGTDMTIDGVTLSNANGTPPQAGIDVEDNVIVGGGQTGALIISNSNATGNAQQGFLIIPHSSISNLYVTLSNNVAYGNGLWGLFATDFSSSNAITITGGQYTNNTPGQIILQSWTSAVLSGEIATGSQNVGLSVNGIPNLVLGPGQLGGSIYDLQIDSFTRAHSVGVTLAHGVINGRYDVGNSLPLVDGLVDLFNPPVGASTTATVAGYLGSLSVAPGVTISNANNIEILDGNVGTGIVNTSGTTVTWVSGRNFIGITAGNTLTIGSASCTVASITSTEGVTCTATQGTQVGVVWLVTGTSAGTITAQRGLNCEDLTSGTFNACAQGNVSAGVNKFNLNMAGSARNFLNSGFQSPPVNLSALTANFPCNSTNYGFYYPSINNSSTNTYGATITAWVSGGGPFSVGAYCDSNTGVYIVH